MDVEATNERKPQHGPTAWRADGGTDPVAILLDRGRPHVGRHARPVREKCCARPPRGRHERARIRVVGVDDAATRPFPLAGERPRLGGPACWRTQPREE